MKIRLAVPLFGLLLRSAALLVLGISPTHLVAQGHGTTTRVSVASDGTQAFWRLGVE